MTAKLVESIESIVAEGSPSAAVVLKKELHDLPKKDLPSVNTYFRAKLAKAPINTREVRECLIDDLSEQQWLEYFREIVLPVIHRFNLIQ